MNNKRTFFIALTFFAAIVACVVPGLPPASAPTLAPTADTSGILSTMVAETVSAAIALTEQAFPTPTPVPASTSTSTPTITPIPEIVPSGSTLTVQEDDSILFVDERAGYEITAPVSWLAVRINQQEYWDALTLAPDIQKSLLSIQNNDPNTFRLFVIDTREGHVQDEFFTTTNFIWNEQGAVLPENDDGLKAIAAQLAETMPGLEITSTKFTTTSNGVLVGIIESKSIMNNSSYSDIVVFQKQAIFNARTGTMTVTVSAVVGFKDEVSSTFDAMLETIKVIAE